jgi:arylsulfatase A-like enzyme
MSNQLTRRELAAALASAIPAKAAEARPNIVFMLSDDHSVPFLGVYGHPVLRTPNMDRLANEGMRFNKAFTAAPQCVPSRAAMMTGRSPAAARIARFNSPLPPDVPVLPELLRKAGYFTGICRRNFHLDGPGPGRSSGVLGRTLTERGMYTFDKRVDYLDRNSPRSATKDRVNEFLDKKPTSKPFFLWISFNDPHHVWDKDAIPTPYDPGKMTVPPFLPDLPGVKDDLSRYCNEVTRLDEEVQWVLDILKERGFADNTIVVFMGDNGMAFPHGKGSLYDPGLNVPLLVRWPGKVKPGTVTDELVSGEDITPTLLDVAGLKPLKEMTGRSFQPLLRGERYEGRRYIFAQRQQHGGSTFDEKTRANGFDLSRCARSSKFKYIYNCTPYQEYWPVDSGNDPGWKDILAAHRAGTLPARFDKAYFTRPRPIFELYDLEADPTEMNNLAGKPEYAAVEKEFREALAEKMIIDYDFLPLPPDV